jgi:predicted DsbA family dithiol-disulfide isomerase
MKQIIKIDVVSDIVCPWCYIGKRRLERAIETLETTYEFEIEYHPFELNPNHPATGVDHRTFLVSKFGSEDRYQALTDHVSSIASQEDLTFNYDLQKILPNTRKAHALVQLAGQEGVQGVLVELLFKAYFTEGTDLSSNDTLLDIAAESGIDRVNAEQYLSDENSLLQVALAEQQMYKLGISGVPFFIINRKYGVSGAQTPDVFIKAFQEITTEKSSVS